MNHLNSIAFNNISLYNQIQQLYNTDGLIYTIFKKFCLKNTDEPYLKILMNHLNSTASAYNNQIQQL